MTNCTFDGHMYNPRRVMEECLAIKPDLVFLWDEAWFGFARFSPFHRRRTAMGAARGAERGLRRSGLPGAIPRAGEAVRQELDPKDKRLLDCPAHARPATRRIRVYQTNSTHKSMSALRQGSMMLVWDEDFQHAREAFEEAFFTHTSTSPNLQTHRVARRGAAADGAGRLRADDAGDRRSPSRSAARSTRIPLISKYFQVATPEDMIPAEFRQSGLKDYGPPTASTWTGRGRGLGRGRVRPRSDPPHAGLRHGRLRRHAVQGPAGGPVRHPAQQDLAQQRPACRPTSTTRAATWRYLIKVLAEISREIEERLKSGGEAGAEGLRRAGEVADDGRARPAELQPLPRRVPRQPEGHDATRATCAPAFFMAYDEDNCEYVKLDQQGDRRAAQERAASWSRPTS